METLATPVFLEGAVVEGKNRGGSQLGCPTANIDVEEKDIQLVNGIYCGFAKLVLKDGTVVVCPHATSIGWNPTFDDVKHKMVEAHLLRDFDSDFYGRTLRIVLLGKIRDEEKFESMDALMSAIRSDVDIAAAACAGEFAAGASLLS